MLRLWAALILSAFVALSACGGDDSTSGFEADLGPIAVDLVRALPEGADVDAVPAVQREFLEWCVKGGQEQLPEIPSVQREGLLAVCGCIYTGTVDHSFEMAVDATPEGADPDPEDLSKRAFEAFKELDEDARVADSLPDALADIARQCIREEAGL